MKKYNLHSINLVSKLWLFLIMGITISCENDFKEPDLFDGAPAPPIITSINDAKTDVEVGTGVIGDFYYIRGVNLATVKTITYNGLEAGFNPVFVTNTLIISRIPLEAPFINTSNKLTVETRFGKADFNLPLLTITDFTETLFDNKNAVVLNGGDFKDVNKVVFATGNESQGNRVEREATILDQKNNALTVEVPAGVIQAFIEVESNGATTRSTSFGFSYPIFTDELIDWELGGFNGSQELSTEVVLGSTSIKRTTDPFGGLTFIPTQAAAPLITQDFSTISFQIYPESTEPSKVALALNDFNAQIVLDLEPQQWNRFVIPITDLYPNGTAPDRITRIDFQEFSGISTVFYFDQFGFIE